MGSDWLYVGLPRCGREHYRRNWKWKSERIRVRGERNDAFRKLIKLDVEADLSRRSFVQDADPLSWEDDETLQLGERLGLM